MLPKKIEYFEKKIWKTGELVMQFRDPDMKYFIIDNRGVPKWVNKIRNHTEALCVAV